MQNFSVEQSLMRAKSYANKGEIIEAQKLYETILKNFSNNLRAQQGLASLKKYNVNKNTQSPPQEVINQLVNLYNQGQFAVVAEQAEVLTKQYPTAILIWNILGAVRSQIGMFDKAIEAYKTTIALKPDYAEAYSNMGVALRNQGKLDEAIDAYQKAISLRPNDADTYFNLGIVLKDQGKFAEAIEAYKKSISLKSDNARVYNNLGVVLQAQDKCDEAIQAYDKAILLKSDYAEAFNNKGALLLKLGKFDKAIDAYKKSISLKPDYAKAYNNMGVAFKEHGKLEEAIEAYKKVFLLEPDNPEAYKNLGAVLNKQGKLDESIFAYKKAISLRSNDADTYFNLGVVLKDQGKFAESIDAYKKSISIKPTDAESYFNLGNTLLDFGRLEEAEESFRQAILLQSDFTEARYNLSWTLLKSGKIKEGLELYECRLKRKRRKARHPRNHLIWDGIKSITGKNFFVYEEQGLGDIIQFCRYLLLLKEKGAEVTFRVQRKMHALLQTLDSDIVLVESDPDEKEIDFECPLMSLPYLFNTNLDTIPSSKSYLFANDDKVISWEKRLIKPTFKIGICWQGGTFNTGVGRDFPLSLFEKISKLPHIELISLHKGDGEKQIKDINFDLTTLGNDFDAGENSFIDTAAVMINCDLIISSDTSITHLAGALGCPIWVPLKKIPEWRWMLDRTDCPWYPNMTLYRQKDFGDWDHVFEIMNRDLVALIKQDKKIQ